MSDELSIEEVFGQLEGEQLALAEDFMCDLPRDHRPILRLMVRDGCFMVLRFLPNGTYLLHLIRPDLKVETMLRPEHLVHLENIMGRADLGIDGEKGEVKFLLPKFKRIAALVVLNIGIRKKG